MTESSDDYWDDLGVTWCAIEPNVSVIASRLEARLRRRSRWMTAIVVIGMPLGAAGVLLGIGTIGAGLLGPWNFVTRGIAILAMSTILTFAVYPLVSVIFWGTTCPLSEMIDLAIEGAQRTLLLLRAGLCSCVIAAVFGLVGTVIRTHIGRPPKMSPIVDLLIVALVALVLCLYGRQIRVELGKYRSLKQALAVDAEA